jgi:hypothetical protein
MVMATRVCWPSFRAKGLSHSLCAQCLPSSGLPSSQFSIFSIDIFVVWPEFSYSFVPVPVFFLSNICFVFTELCIVKMPPKRQKPTKKSERKEKEKVVEDRTFGLKNKNRSSKVQKFMKSVAMQVHGQGKKSTAVTPAEAGRV